MLRVMVTLCCLFALTMFSEIARHLRWLPRLTGNWIKLGLSVTVLFPVAQLALEREGMEVVTANDGADGIQAFKGNRHKLVAILLDMTMPRMGGAAAYAELRKLGVEVPVVLMSGHSKDVAVEDFHDAKSVRFLQKPFSVESLINSVSGALSRN
jgi:DNA-binding NtrC family response regulator